MAKSNLVQNYYRTTEKKISGVKRERKHSCMGVQFCFTSRLHRHESKEERKPSGESMIFFRIFVPGDASTVEKAWRTGPPWN